MYKIALKIKKKKHFTLKSLSFIYNTHIQNSPIDLIDERRQDP